MLDVLASRVGDQPGDCLIDRGLPAQPLLE
jgi:hypothetical protein